ncbi:ABC transporter substrate-binding protein [Terasakiella sp. A23]|uniref:substrate-binding periplasmic protein n=1 Tax=Terasakiella sp. FCG-A23 TaxID=3080561 RepID=UPI002952A762|nr:ABC transporter substrate-binding protein [Terasakiella sp. A23]MDV7339258.1 ABC transporter substrate-binding protein [Terasakiella sp. A23]
MVKIAFKFVLFILLLKNSAFANDYRILAQPFPPFSIHSENKSVSGFSIDLFQLLLAATSKTHNYEIFAVSFNRLYTELQKAERRVGIAVVKNKQREDLFHWVGPYLSIEIGVVGKTRGNFSVSSIDDLARYKVTTVKNAAPEQALKKLGFPVHQLDSSFDPNMNLLKLHNGRVPLMAHPLEAVSYMMGKSNIDAKEYEQVFSIRKVPLYFAFSKDFSETELNGFKEALKLVLFSSAYNKLAEKYNLYDIKIRKIRNKM